MSTANAARVTMRLSPMYTPLYMGEYIHGDVIFMFRKESGMYSAQQ